MKRLQARGMSRAKAIERIRSWTRRREEAKKHTQPFMKKYGLKAESELHTKAIQWVLRNPNLGTICVSMPSFELVDRYVPLSGTRLSRADRELLREFRLARGADYCRHACSDCAGACPHDLPVSTIRRYAGYFQQGREKLALRKYADLGPANASLCLDCEGHCVGACPHGGDIRLGLLHSHSLLTLA
jgi:ferredoxin